jgi:hypothetical protein
LFKKERIEDNFDIIRVDFFRWKWADFKFIISVWSLAERNKLPKENGMITLFQALNWMTTTTLLPLFLLFIYSFLSFGLPSCSPCAHRAQKESERLSKLAQTGRDHSDICNNLVHETEGESGGGGPGRKLSVRMWTILVYVSKFGIAVWQHFMCLFFPMKSAILTGICAPFVVSKNVWWSTYKSLLSQAPGYRDFASHVRGHFAWFVRNSTRCDQN